MRSSIRGKNLVGIGAPSEHEGHVAGGLGGVSLGFCLADHFHDSCDELLVHSLHGLRVVGDAEGSAVGALKPVVGRSDGDLPHGACELAESGAHGLSGPQTIRRNMPFRKEQGGRTRSGSGSAMPLRIPAR